MTLTIQEEANASVGCTFFNQSTFRWSTEGLRRVAATNVSSDTRLGAVFLDVCAADDAEVAAADLRDGSLEHLRRSVEHPGGAVMMS